MKQILFFFGTVLFLASCAKQAPVQVNSNQPVSQNCELGVSYENTAVKHVGCQCPENYEFKTLDMGWGPCPEPTMSDCAASTLICVKKVGTYPPITAKDLTDLLAAGAELNDTDLPAVNLPAEINYYQIDRKFFKLGDIYLALVKQPSMNINLSGLPNNFSVSYVGLIATKADQQTWTELLKLEDENQTDKNNPYYLWVKDSKIYLSVVDQNGAGSGEGLMKVLTLNEQNHWVLTGCYYFSDTFNDGDYYQLSRELDKFAAKPLTECSNLQWQE